MCYQLSRYKRDLLDHNTIEQPAWLHCVGSIYPDNFDAIESSDLQTTSSIEEYYFEHDNFYKIKDTPQPRLKLMRLADQTYASCLITMKEYADYQSSSTSIYKAGSFCVEEQNKKSIHYKFDMNGISQKRDPDTKLISLTIGGKKLLSDQNF